MFQDGLEERITKAYGPCIRRSNLILWMTIAQKGGSPLAMPGISDSAWQAQLMWP